jgi:polysaccharide export outer membrane protein
MIRKWSKSFLLLCLCLIWFSQGQAQEKSGPASPGPAGAGVPADSDSYIIGPEDVLDIYVWKETDLSRKVPVRLDGKISIPLVGEIQAAGITPLQLKERLIQKFKDYVEVPNVTVTVLEANSFKVFISGQVAKPGVYTLRSETTLLQFISLAGGFTEWANQRKILLVRQEQGKEKRFTINYKKIISGEDLSQNMVLKPGDVIVVPD